MGDHVYKKADILPTLQSSERIVRPANLSSGATGRGSTVVTTNSGVTVGVFAVLGRIFMNQLPSNDPFAAADTVLSQFPKHVRVCVCDVHAEATSEKVAMGHWLDGRCSVVFGTHTHIQTADARVLPGGTAAITDAGMTGPHDSVIGVKAELAIRRMRTGMPVRFEPAEGDVRIEGVLVECDASGRALSCGC